MRSSLFYFIPDYIPDYFKNHFYYFFRLKGEKDLCALIEKAMDYMHGLYKDKGIFLDEEICKLYMLRIEHVYYKVIFFIIYEIIYAKFANESKKK